MIILIPEHSVRQRVFVWIIFIVNIMPYHVLFLLLIQTQGGKIIALRYV
jgi:hypothetical protein